jgi:hypothetical protein
MVVMAYLGSVTNEFIYNQWERKGMNTDVYCSGSALLMLETQRQAEGVGFVVC